VSVISAWGGVFHNTEQQICTEDRHIFHTIPVLTYTRAKNSHKNLFSSPSATKLLLTTITTITFLFLPFELSYPYNSFGSTPSSCSLFHSFESAQAPSFIPTFTSRPSTVSTQLICQVKLQRRNRDSVNPISSLVPRNQKSRQLRIFTASQGSRQLVFD
jgi:hypothetical protein